jgi:branched-chain amino acid transport system permease protein
MFLGPVLVLTQALNGLQYGLMLFLFAAGLTLVLGIMNLVNLAHGSLYMLGAFFAASLYAWIGSLWLAILLAVPAIFLAGVVIEWVVLRHLYRRDHLEQVLATFGLILFLNEVARIIWGDTPLDMPVPSLLAGRTLILPGITYPTYRLAIIALGLIVALLLYLLVARTKLGMLIRAGASNREMVEAIGVNIGLIFTLIFGLGAALAGLAGMAVGPLISVDPSMGNVVLILALVVIVIGGIGSIRGSFVAAIIVGVVDTLGRAFVPGLLITLLPRSIADAVGPALSSMLIYLLMAAVLLFRPQGLIPAPAGAGGEGAPMSTRRLPASPRQEAAVGIAIMAALAIVPWAVGGQPFYVALVSRVMIFGIAALSLNLLVGFGGMVSFGHAAFLGVGAYVVGIAVANGVTAGIVHLALVVAVSALVALAIGAVCLRTSGLHFLMITLAFAQLVYFIAIGLKQYGGDDGFSFSGRSDFGAWLNLGRPVVFYYFVWAVLVACLILIYRLVNSRFGLALQGARLNERRARALGLPVYRYRLTAFVIAGTICGIAGGLLANLTQFASPDYMSWAQSGDLLVMVIAGGISSVVGPLVGALLYLLFQDVLSAYTSHWPAIIGPALVLLVLFARAGAMGALRLPGVRPWLPRGAVRAGHHG